MLEIREFEELLNGSRDFDEASDNRTMLWAYENTRAEDNARLDFNDVIWDADIKPISRKLRMLGIKEFTISVRQGNLTDILAAFQELGIFIKGTIQIKSRYTEHNVISAILMELV